MAVPAEGLRDGPDLSSGQMGLLGLVHMPGIGTGAHIVTGIGGGINLLSTAPHTVGAEAETADRAST